jgi:GNAT superfamily N-acetyltransferase
VGTRLVEAFRGWARYIGADLLTVTAYAGNEPAREFYRRMGFVDHKITMEAAHH